MVRELDVLTGTAAGSPAMNERPETFRSFPFSKTRISSGRRSVIGRPSLPVTLTSNWTSEVDILTTSSGVDDGTGVGTSWAAAKTANNAVTKMVSNVLYILLEEESFWFLLIYITTLSHRVKKIRR